jgi:hypothetical protein
MDRFEMMAIQLVDSGAHPSKAVVQVAREHPFLLKQLINQRANAGDNHVASPIGEATATWLSRIAELLATRQGNNQAVRRLARDEPKLYKDLILEWRRKTFKED